MNDNYKCCSRDRVDEPDDNEMQYVVVPLEFCISEKC